MVCAKKCNFIRLNTGITAYSLTWPQFCAAKTNRFRIMKKILFWLLPALSIFACKSAEKVTYTPDQLVPTEKALLWKISANGLKKPSYLYGTIHVIPKDKFQLSVSAQAALESAQRLVFEIDMKEMTNFGAQMSMMTKSFMAGGKTLKDLLSPEDYAFVKSKLSTKGLPTGMFERLKPMFLSTIISSDEESLGTAANMTSVEMELYQLSNKKDLLTGGLETASYQLSLFDSIPYEAQAKMLVDALRTESASAEGDSELDQMLKMYYDQDITAMQKLIGSEESDMGNYEEILLLQRNRNWIPVMGRYMLEKPSFFAVGSGHLGGPQGVIALLRKAGYRVEAVN